MFPLVWDPRDLAYNAYRHLQCLLPWSKLLRFRRTGGDPAVGSVSDKDVDEDTCTGESSLGRSNRWWYSYVCCAD